jgi:hypothetical protein
MGLLKCCINAVRSFALSPRHVTFRFSPQPSKTHNPSHESSRNGQWTGARRTWMLLRQACSLWAAPSLENVFRTTEPRPP